MTPRLLLPLVLAALTAACASRGTGREVAAVVQDEGARQAAVATAQEGEGSKAALKAGAEAAVQDKAPSEPPL
jgi:hypothetical protein